MIMSTLAKGYLFILLTLAFLLPYSDSVRINRPSKIAFGERIALKIEIPDASTQQVCDFINTPRFIVSEVWDSDKWEHLQGDLFLLVTQ